MKPTISQSVFDNVSEHILIINTEDYSVVDANKTLLEALKLKKEEVTGKTCFAITHNRSTPCAAPNDLCPISEMLRTGNPMTVEHTHYDKDGTPFYVEVSASPVRDKDGKITHAVHMARDISERKRLEKELLRFKLGIELSGDVIFLTDVEGVIVYVNPMFEKVYGFTEAESLGKTARILKSGTLNPEVYKQFWGTLLAGKVFAGELVNKTKDGRLITIGGSANPIIDEQGNLVGYLAIQRDITERKRMEAEIKGYSEHLEELVDQKVGLLEESEERFRAISTSAMDAIVVMDNEGKISYWNPAAESMFGYTTVEALGKNLHELIAPERFRKKFFEVYKKFGETGQGAFIGKTRELAAVGKAGLEFPIELSLSAFQLGGKWHATGMIRNISERKRMEEQLKDITYNLEGVAPGGSYLSVTLERSFKVYFDLVSHGVRGLAIVRDDPAELVKKYGLKPEDIKLLSTRALKGYPNLGNLQDVSLAISSFLKAGGGVVLLDGLAYLVSMFGFEAVYRFIQEKRFDFLESGALLIMPVNMAVLDEKEKALLTSETKTLT